MLGRSLALSAGPGGRFSPRGFLVMVTTALCVYVVDHVIKQLIVSRLPLNEQWPSSGPIVLHHIDNSGAAFGLFPQLQVVFLAVAVIVSGYILVAGHRLGGGMWTQVILGAILGGAIANGIDRLRQGYVVDYVDLHRWPIFNLADSCIVVGILAAVLVVGRQPAGRAGHPPAEDRAG